MELIMREITKKILFRKANYIFLTGQDLRVFLMVLMKLSKRELCTLEMGKVLRESGIMMVLFPLVF